MGAQGAATVLDPGELGGEGVATHRWRAAGASHHQLGHRAEITGVGLEGAQQLLGAGLFDRRRVELHHLGARRAQSGHQGAVVVAGALHTDATQLGRRDGLGSSHRGEQGRHAGLGEGELEGLDDHLSVMVGHQRHRGGLADVDRHHQTGRRVKLAQPCHEGGLQGATDEPGHHGGPR